MGWWTWISSTITAVLLAVPNFITSKLAGKTQEIAPQNTVQTRERRASSVSDKNVIRTAKRSVKPGSVRKKKRLLPELQRSDSESTLNRSTSLPGSPDLASQPRKSHKKKSQMESLLKSSSMSVLPLLDKNIAPCDRCGEDVDWSLKFCNRCGDRLGDVDSVVKLYVPVFALDKGEQIYVCEPCKVDLGARKFCLKCGGDATPMYVADAKEIGIKVLNDDHDEPIVAVDAKKSSGGVLSSLVKSVTSLYGPVQAARQTHVCEACKIDLGAKKFCINCGGDTVKMLASDAVALGIEVKPPTEAELKSEESLLPASKETRLLTNAKLGTTTAGRRAPSKNPVRDRQARPVLEPTKPAAKKQPGLNMMSAQLLGLKDNVSSNRLVSVAPDDKGPRLYHIKGRRHCVVRRIEPTAKNLNSGDVFILDAGKLPHPLLYQWNGSSANRIEKGRGMDFAKRIRDKERVGATTTVLEEGQEDDRFWKLLGGKCEVGPADSAGDDLEFEREMRKDVALYRVVLENPSGDSSSSSESVKLNSSGDDAVNSPDASPKTEKKAVMVLESEFPLKKDMLDINNCYILISGHTCYAWTGGKSTITVRNAALQLALDEAKKMKGWVAPVSRELPGSEQVMFKERFSDWGGSLPIAMQQIPVGINVAAAKAQIKIDLEQLISPKQIREDAAVDDGSGVTRVWRVEEYEKVEQPKEFFGQFWTQDTYLIQYTYMIRNKENFLIYFYQGRGATWMDKGASALLTIELDKELNGAAKEIRVVQNKEPKHFRMMFKGRFMIHQGKDPLGASANTKPKAPAVGLYDVRGLNLLSTKAVQVDTTAAALHSDHTAIVTQPDKEAKQYIWSGVMSPSYEKEMAQQVLHEQNYHSVQHIVEGSEPEEFWTLLGGKREYACKNHTAAIAPRAYVCSVASGVFTAEEVFPFVQDDLLEEDVILLDAHSRIYVWIGYLSVDIERRLAYQLAVDYLEIVSKKGRSLDTPVLVVHQHYEPPHFAAQFSGWQFGTKTKSGWSANPPTENVADILAEYTRKYTYEELKEKKFPKGLDTAALECYLEDSKFEELFKTSRDEFAKWPLYKQQDRKKELGLY